MEKICGIYVIENIVNNSRYIGSSKHIISRIRGHFRCLSRNGYKNSHLQNAFNKYGKDNFIGKILILCDLDMLLFYEQLFIDAWNPEYNISKIAGRIEMNDYVRNKISNSKMGHTVSESARKAISERMKGKQYSKGHKVPYESRKILSAINTGKIASDETKRKMSESHKGNQCAKGYKFSVEQRKNVSLANKGRKMPDKTRNALYIANKGNNYGAGHKMPDKTRNALYLANKGHIVSEETRKAISIANKGKARSDEFRKTISARMQGNQYAKGDNSIGVNLMDNDPGDTYVPDGTGTYEGSETTITYDTEGDQHCEVNE